MTESLSWKGDNEMGFWVMIGSLLLGIFAISFGANNIKKTKWSKALIAVGGLFVLAAVVLALPK